MNFIKDYITLGSIVVAEDACERETYAAEELRYYFIRMTGHKVDAKRISEPADDAVLFDNSQKTVEESVAFVLSLLRERGETERFGL